MTRLTRRDMARVVPTALVDGDHVASEAVVDLIHHVLPSLGRRYLRKFMRHEGVRTLVLLLPEDLAQLTADGKSDTSSSDDDDDDADDTDDKEGSGAAKADRESGGAAEERSSDTPAKVAAEADEGEDVEDHDDDDDDDEEEESDEEADNDDGPGLPAGLDPAARALMKRRLAGAVCYEEGERLGERLIQVSLLGVRLRYQRLGVATRLLRVLLSGEASDQRPEAAIAWADTRAIPFFKRHGFAEDPLLNARYREISAPWARSTLMSAQLAPPVPDAHSSGAGALSSASSWVGAGSLNDTLESWRKTRLLEYSKELCLIERLHAEIRSLREKVSVQQGHAAVLMAENAKLRNENSTIAREFEAYRRARSATAAEGVGAEALDLSDSISAAGAPSGRAPGSSPGGRAAAAAAGAAGMASARAAAASSAAEWIAEAEAEAAREVAEAVAAATSPGARSSTAMAASPASSRIASRPPSVPASPASPSGKARQRWGASLAEGLSNEDLQEALRRCKPGAAGPMTDLRLRKWIAPTEASATTLRLRHASCRALLTDPSLTLRLFFGAPQADLLRLLEHGFDGAPPDPHGLGIYGRGWYFSKYATHAHHYTAGGGCVLLAEVAVGNTETVVRRDPSRGAPSAGFDSMVVPGRRLPSAGGLRGGGAGGDVNEEYVIFDGSQAVPLCLIHYSHEEAA